MGDKLKTAVGIARYGFAKSGWRISADNAIITIPIANINLKKPDNIE